MQFKSLKNGSKGTKSADGDIEWIVCEEVGRTRAARRAAVSGVDRYERSSLEDLDASGSLDARVPSRMHPRSHQ